MRVPKQAGVCFASLGLFLLLAQAARSEYRTWTATTGVSVEAEFVELHDNGSVRLRLKSGDLRDVPLEKLSAADRQMANELAAAGSKQPQHSALEQEVSQAHTAEDAYRLYRVMYDDPATTAAQREAISVQLTHYRDLAARNLVRVGSKWVTAEGASLIRAKADALMRQGLEFLRLKQLDACRKKFNEAAALEPDSLRADFFLALLYGVVADDNEQAQRGFQSCLKREPDNVAVLNNLAITEVKLREPRNAILHWRKIIELG
ncbi:MAG TPA: SHD1 domain-containing protein, partial [Pirellulales bacterium]|nr:SHD1 domain-containing protein [Pirellulales bacterium]